MAGIAHLAKSSYNEQLKTLKDVETFLIRCYPRLEIEEVQLGTYEVKRSIRCFSAKNSLLLHSAIGLTTRQNSK